MRDAVLSLSTADDRLYSATAADWSSRDSLIYSRPLRTEQHNSHWLNGTVHPPVSLCLCVYVCLLISSRVSLFSLFYGVTALLWLRQFPPESHVINVVRPVRMCARASASLLKWMRMPLPSSHIHVLLQSPLSLRPKVWQRKQYHVPFNSYIRPITCAFTRPM